MICWNFKHLMGLLGLGFSRDNMNLIGAIFSHTKKTTKQSPYGGLLYAFLCGFGLLAKGTRTFELMGLWNANDDRNNK